jgi:hypothetical protein
MTTTISFPHGLGDCVYFAHQLPLYQRRGHNIKIVCNKDKRWLFPVECVLTEKREAPKVPWNHAKQLEFINDENHWMTNKAMFNISAKPMPDIGLPSAALWAEFASEKVDIINHISEQASEMVKSYFKQLERPITLLHTKGNSFQSGKSVPDELAVAIYRAILDEIGGTLILLDWDNRVPRIAHGRIKHLTDDWKRLTLEELMAAILQADLVVGIDSGPLHLCRFSETPAVGLWFHGHHPSIYSLPRERQVNITLKRNAPQANKQTRWFYNIVEEQGEQVRAAIVGRTCRQLLEPPRYLSRSQCGKDVVLRHWIGDWTRSNVSSHRTFVDRDQSFDLMLRHLSGFKLPKIVETGCIRAEEDWQGAGFSTYLLGAYAAGCDGKLDSVDTGEKHCAFARKWTRVFGKHVAVHCDDSLHYLCERREQTDLLYLDSWDANVPGFAEHGLKEIQKAEHLLHAKSMVVYDDTSILAGKWQGKGMLGVPWMIERGWRPVHIGHQTVLVRT